ncbi:MAG: MATE family efflux transporter [Clostridia bacterium]|nr:MATE family efflux transporter [Clostridia bacterium]MBQ3869148.1 MATE family efflux transporter [Clostridia bacterium]
MMKFLTKFYGDKAFLKIVLSTAVPIVLQNGITSLVSALDNIMVGRLCSEATSGVAIVNQFMFVFFLVTFGAVSGAGILTAQYHGSGNVERVRDTFRAKLLICVVAAATAMTLFFFLQDQLINSFLSSETADIDPELTFRLGKEYLNAVLVSMIPYSLSAAYSTTLRETGKAVVPMAASVSAVLINLTLNYLLIFGKLGLPELGVKGAAYATVISRFAEFAILIIWTSCNKKKCPFIVGALRSFRIPRAVTKKIVVMGAPLMLNEGFWALSVTVRNQCYATRGLDAVTSLSISSAVSNLLSEVYFALGLAIAVIIGNMLGAGRIEEAKDADKKLIRIAMTAASFVGIGLLAISPFFPKLYNTTEGVFGLSAYMIAVQGLLTPIYAYAHASYFTLRSGGRVFITVLFDSAFMWVIAVPLAFSLSHFTDMSIYPLYAICQGCEILKSLLGFILLRRGTWARRIVSENEGET